MLHAVCHRGDARDTPPPETANIQKMDHAERRGDSGSGTLGHGGRGCAVPGVGDDPATPHKHGQTLARPGPGNFTPRRRTRVERTLGPPQRPCADVHSEQVRDGPSLGPRDSGGRACGVLRARTLPSLEAAAQTRAAVPSARRLCCLPLAEAAARGRPARVSLCDGWDGAPLCPRAGRLGRAGAREAARISVLVVVTSVDSRPSVHSGSCGLPRLSHIAHAGALRPGCWAESRRRTPSPVHGLQKGAVSHVGLSS